MPIFFTSDTHFGHKNIIKYCARPFSSVEEMDEEMIKRWNVTVAPDDIVYHLGDFALGNKKNIPSIRQRLNGKIVLVRGNHDRGGSDAWYEEKAGFAAVWKGGISRSLLPGEDTPSVYMHHQPVWDETIWGDSVTHFCGHVHERWRSQRDGRVINVGVDVWDFRPMELSELLTRAREPWTRPISVDDQKKRDRLPPEDM